LFVERAAEIAGGGPVAVASPDPGGVKRAQLFREALAARLGRDVGFAMLEKRRSAGVVSGSLMAGEVAGARVLVIDDMIASGGTMTRAARTLRAGGAKEVWALAAHGLFTEGAAEALADPAVTGWIVSDTVPPFRLPRKPEHLEVISAAPLFAEALRRLNEGEDVCDLTPAAG
ncbi:MAG: ribose-phosphate pyrophosphokinase, partial [Alphaproteobacteria bacterium]